MPCLLNHTKQKKVQTLVKFVFTNVSPDLLQTFWVKNIVKTADLEFKRLRSCKNDILTSDEERNCDFSGLAVLSLSVNSIGPCRFPHSIS